MSRLCQHMPYFSADFPGCFAAALQRDKEGLKAECISRAHLERPLRFWELGRAFSQWSDATALQMWASKDAGPELRRGLCAHLNRPGFYAE